MVTALVMCTSSAPPSLRSIRVLTPLHKLQHLQVFGDGQLIIPSSFVYLTICVQQGNTGNFRCCQRDPHDTYAIKNLLCIITVLP